MVETFYFLVFFLICLSITYIIVKILMKKNSYSLYGLLYNISKNEILSYALIYLNLVFVIFSAIFSNDYSAIFLDYHFYFILFTSLIFDIVNQKVFKIFFDLINSAIIYYMLFLKSGFYDYMTNIFSSWYIIITYILIIIFIIIYEIYFSFRNINIVVMNNKSLKERKDLYEK